MSNSYAMWHTVLFARVKHDRCLTPTNIFKTVITGPTASLIFLEKKKEYVTIIRSYGSDKIYKNVTIICIFYTLKNQVFGYPPQQKRYN